jgi:ParB family chromosome partitioning protein
MLKKPNVAGTIGKSFDDARGGASKAGSLRGMLKDENQARILLIPLDEIEPNPEQPRKHFDRKALEDLTASVRDKGILQPIIVRKKADSTQCIIVAGERRWRAAKAAGLKDMPALLRGEEDAREVAIIENLQRENLNAVEEAEALLALKMERGYTDAELAKIVGKSRSSITESLSLAQLPETIKARCRTSDIASKSQLLQVLRAGSPEKTEAAFRALETGTLSTVRELRRETRQTKATSGRPKHARFEYAPKNRKYHLTITFPKKTASRSDLQVALKDALKHLR